MGRPKKASTRKIERLQEQVENQEQLLRQQLSESNPLYNEIQKLTMEKTFVMHCIQLKLDAEAHRMMCESIRGMVQALASRHKGLSDDNRALLNEMTDKFLDDHETLLRLAETLKGEIQ